LPILENENAILEIGPDEDLTRDPAASFGITEAKLHRKRGVSIGMFLGLMKYYRQSYKDLVSESQFDSEYKHKCVHTIERFFDRVEIGFCGEWAALEEKQQIKELQSTNRSMTNEKNKYLTIFESIPNPVVMVDSAKKIEHMNRSASLLFHKIGIPGAHYYRDLTGNQNDQSESAVSEPIGKMLPWLSEELDAFLAGKTSEYSFEKRVDGVEGQQSYHIEFSRNLDVSGKFGGTIIILDDISTRKKMEDKPRSITKNLQQNVNELKKANRQIIEQQKAVIEEERLKVLLQMAGATAHEMNQPLMTLLGSIELMDLDMANTQKLKGYMAHIKESGQRIAQIVKKIQTIRHDEIKPYVGNSTIVNLDQIINILSVEGNDDDYAKIESILTDLGKVNLIRACDVSEAFSVMEGNSIDLIFLDYLLPSGTGADFLLEMNDRDIDLPVVIITGHGDEIIASQVIQAGAYDYLPKANISKKSLSRVIGNSIENYRLKKEVTMAMGKMAEMSTRDDLTGLYNRRYFIEVSEREIAKAQRYENELVLCMLDLDYFKKVNDTHGHAAGDKVLKEVAGLLQESVRKSDVPCRYGGEEFAVIMANTHLDDGEKFCERLRIAVENHPISYNGSNLNVTVSIGVAQFTPAYDHSATDLLEKADSALYLAKREGRNKVMSSIMDARKK
jgi:two-component system cell cycle response regulator